MTDTAERIAAEAPGTDAALLDWVAGIAQLTRPDRVEWFDGSSAASDALVDTMVEQGTAIRLSESRRPRSILVRSDPSDVGRVEDRTFICSELEADAGPTNNWMAPRRMREVLDPLFDGCMRGRTMYVVPFSMGPVGSPLAQLGVQVTDSPYVAASMSVMTRAGAEPLRQIESGGSWVPAVHSVGAPLSPGDADVPWPCNAVKYIAHFPETREIWSFGSAYGGNAILAKKSFALRIASVIAREGGWLAEHMLILKVTDPAGRTMNVAAAFPSACGKTNLAMLQSTLSGWSVETIGDDIAWMVPDAAGRLRAINPEAGFFGVAPGTGESTNVNAVIMLEHDAVFTNVALTDDGDVWWEGLTDEVPERLTDWQGQPWTPASSTPAAHPNSRFTVAAGQCPSIAAEWQDPEGVVVDAIVFGGRRASNVPLVLEASGWEHGVFLGATISSEQTAAAEGTVGELRRDPFAMLPFCGYNMADHWSHWLEVGRRLTDPPRMFQVNWFRKDERGRFLWPGFGENIRVLKWMMQRVHDEVGGAATPLGTLPHRSDFDLRGLELADAAWQALFDIKPTAWLAEADDTERFLDSFGPRVPVELRAALGRLRAGRASGG